MRTVIEVLNLRRSIGGATQDIVLTSHAAEVSEVDESTRESTQEKCKRFVWG